MTRGRVPLRVWLPPLLLLAAAGVTLIWAQRGDLEAGELAALSGDNLRQRVRQHLDLAVAGTLLAVAVALPAGIAVTRPRVRRLAPVALLFANLGQTVPTVAVLALTFTVAGIGFTTAVIALWIYSLLPILRNTLAGLAGVDPAVTEAARGMGMSPVQVLRRVELPLAWPVILAGIRTAAVVNVGTAALGTFVGAGGLGALIDAGIQNQRYRLLYTGASLTALLALAADWGLATLGYYTGGRAAGAGAATRPAGAARSESKATAR